MNIHSIKPSQPFGLLPPFYEPRLHPAPDPLLQEISHQFGIVIERYAYVVDAFDHDVLIVNDEIVFRFPRTERDRQFLSVEIEFLNSIRDRVEVRVPEYKFVSADHNFAGYPVIPQGVLTPWDFAELDARAKESAVTQLVEFINTMHAIDLDEFKRFRPRMIDDFLEWEQRVDVELSDKLFPKLSANEVDVIVSFYDGARTMLNEIPFNCALHGDLYAFNVIWDDRKSKIGVIDFSDLLIGDPAHDFEVFFDYGPEYAESAYEQYRGPKDAAFLQRAEMYYKLHAIYTLLSSQLGALITFEHARLRFQQKFSL